MSTSERIDKFFNDINQFISSKNTKKLLSEIDRLKVWLIKHQNESATESAKSKLFSLIESCCRYNREDESYIESVQSLLSSYLAIPEGKLTTSKAKKKLISWVSNNDVNNNSSNSTDSNDILEIKPTQEKWMIVDIITKNHSFSLISESGGILDNISLREKSLFGRIKEIFENESYVAVYLDDRQEIIECYDSEDNCIK